MKTKTLMIGLGLTLLTIPRTFAIEAVTLDPILPVPSLVQKTAAESAIPNPLTPIPVVVVPKINPALEQYNRRPVSELSKLVYLGDFLKQSGLMIIYGSHTYDPKLIAPMVRAYVQFSYKKETAEAYVQKHAYRNGASNRILYVKDSEGKLTELREFLLSELKQL